MHSIWVEIPLLQPVDDTIRLSIRFFGGLYQLPSRREIYVRCSEQIRVATRTFRYGALVNHGYEQSAELLFFNSNPLIGSKFECFSPSSANRMASRAWQAMLLRIVGDTMYMNEDKPPLV